MKEMGGKKNEMDVQKGVNLRKEKKIKRNEINIEIRKTLPSETRTALKKTKPKRT